MSHKNPTCDSEGVSLSCKAFKAGIPGKTWTTDAHLKAFRIAKEALKRAQRLGLVGGEYQGVCASSCGICGGTENLALDHNHETGQLRGRLCRNCNAGLGFFRDDPELLAGAIEYLVDAAEYAVLKVPGRTADDDTLDLMIATGRPHLGKRKRRTVGLPG